MKKAAGQLNTVHNEGKITRDELQSLSQKNLSLWLKDSLINWSIIIMAFVLVYYTKHPLTCILAVFVLGNRQHAIGIQGHDGAHFAVFRSKAVNDFVANILGFLPLGITVSGYRNLHFAHHKNTNTDEDPELLHKRFRAPQWNLPVKPTKILQYAFMDLFGHSVKDYAFIVMYAKPSSKRDYAYLAAFHVTAVSVLLFFGLWWVLALWYVSLLTTFMMFFRLRLWLEHQGTDSTLCLHLSWWQRHLLAPHNIWYHWEHHHYPAVPYYRLPKLRKILRPSSVMSLSDLISFFENSVPRASGEVIKGTV